MGEAAQTEDPQTGAIMFTDIVGFSRQMGADEARMLRLLDVHNQLIQQAVAEHHGTVIKTMGDAFLVDFPSVVHAVQCAQRIQAQFRTHNAEKEKPSRFMSASAFTRATSSSGMAMCSATGSISPRGCKTRRAGHHLYLAVVYKEVEKKRPWARWSRWADRSSRTSPSGSRSTRCYLNRPRASANGCRSSGSSSDDRRAHCHWPRALVLLIGAGARSRQVLPCSLPTPTPHPQSLPLPDKPSIVVLPFANMSEDPEQEYFSDGITEDITTDLSKISSLFVIARNSAFTYKGKAVKVQDVSRETGRAVCVGRQRAQSGRSGTDHRAVDRRHTGDHLWSERYDRPLKDIFALQDEIVQKIVTTLKLQLTLREQGYLVRKTTDNLEAYDYYLRGMESFRALHERGECPGAADV